ncbi:hypothetical protein V6N13_086238 [Hibiscus sabdariffa]
MALPGLGPFATADTAACTVSSAEDPSKKIRKPYTISKSRESWTEPEHDKFLEAIQLFDRDWKKIEAYIGSKTVIQIRSHAQKYFLKVQKNGTSEHLPPPRPKRKAAHPYPQKASKNALGHPQVSEPLQSPSTLLDTEYVLRSDPPLMLINPVTRAVASSQTNNTQTINLTQDKKGTGMTNNSCSSTECTRMTRQIGEIADQGNQGHALRVLPDFAQVYSFIGSVFDPNAISHLQKLKKMDPIDVETVLLLMRNLSINLTSPDFEDHRNLVSSYEIDTETNNNGALHFGPVHNKLFHLKYVEEVQLLEAHTFVVEGNSLLLVTPAPAPTPTGGYENDQILLQQLGGAGAWEVVQWTVIGKCSGDGFLKILFEFV